MKAILFEKYGLPLEVLKIKEVTRPVPKNNEVLVKIQAAAVNDYDWSLVRGSPLLYRLMFGILKPKHKIPGMELSGFVEEIGSKVRGLKVGDAVFGDISGYGFGTFAEYICIDENAVIKKPDFLSFEEAASIPHAFTLASQALKGLGKIRQGQKVLINGGGGGVGSMGVQLAKLYNCEVTGVDAGEKLSHMTSLGFDSVLDYMKTDFTANGAKFDLILDCKTDRSPFSYLRVLNPTGKYVTIGGKPGSLLKILIFGKLTTLFSGKKLLILSLKPNKALKETLELFNQNKILCKIDGPYLLEDIPRLIQYFGDGKHKGKIVIRTNAI